MGIQLSGIWLTCARLWVQFSELTKENRKDSTNANNSSTVFPKSLCPTSGHPKFCHLLMPPPLSWVLAAAWSGLRSGHPVLILSQAAFQQPCRSASSPVASASLAHLWQGTLLSLGSHCSIALLTTSSRPHRISSHTDPVNIFSQSIPSFGPVLPNKIEKVGRTAVASCRGLTHFTLNFTELESLGGADVHVWYKGGILFFKNDLSFSHPIHPDHSFPSSPPPSSYPAPLLLTDLLFLHFPSGKTRSPEDIN